jgi:hypothetical protein
MMRYILTRNEKRPTSIILKIHSETLLSNLDTQLANEASLLLFESGKL